MSAAAGDPRAWLRAGAATALGCVTGVGVELGDVHAVLRTPLALSRRVGFVALAGGSGTSATAGYVADLLAARRAGTVLGVDAGGGPVGPGWWCGTRGTGARPAPSESDARTRALARTAVQARAGLPVSGSGLCVLDLGGPGCPAPSVARWRNDVTPVARFYDLVVTDWGVRPAGADLAEVAAASHVLAVVTRADRYAADAAAEALPALQSQPEAPRCVLVLVDVGHGCDRPAHALRARVAVPVLTVRHDRAWARARPGGSAALARVTRLDLLRLAGTLVSGVVPPRADAVLGPAAPAAPTAPTAPVGASA